jgi:spectinomycin phosphotransferase
VTTIADLARDYGLAATDLQTHPGGFNSDCVVADGTWFVKIWRRTEAPTGLALLGDLRTAGLPVPTPIATATGQLHAWSEGRPYAVFPYVAGRTANKDDWRLTAQALAQVHRLDGIDLAMRPIDEPDIWPLRDHLDHPWIRDRRHEVAANIARLEETIARANAKPVRNVVCHRDFGGFNLLLDDGEVVAILDWERAVLGPREHDLWMAVEGPFGTEFLNEYGAYDLDRDHLEYALLARALRDTTARVLTETDRDGVDTWGFQRIAKLERDLATFTPFCA